MKKTWISFYAILGLVFLLVMSFDVASAQNDVTFQVNMRIKMLEGTFLPDSGDAVLVRGTFNSFGNTDTLTDGNLDSIYTKTLSMAAGSIEYKFYKTLREGLDWEDPMPNRQYTVPPGGAIISVVYFANDSVYNPPTADVPVTFQVNMRVKMLEGTFLPGSGDVALVRGSFNGFGTIDTVRDADVDSIYTKTITLMEGANYEYKFYKTRRGALDWEDPMPNRQYTVPPGGGPIPVVYFANDSVVNAVTANTLFKVNMNAYVNLGWFRPDLNDSMEIRGPFTGWETTPEGKMDDPFATSVYEVLVPVIAGVNEDVPYKLFIDFDSAGATARFPGYVHSGTDPNRDDFAYEHPAERGDGNRLYNVGSGGNVSPPVYWYSSIHENGVINAGDTVAVMVNVNMGPATRYSDAFVPGSDTVIFFLHDDLVFYAQRANQGGSFNHPRLTPVGGPTDTMYTGSFTYVGPTHYNFLYDYRYIHAGGGSPISEAGGLGVQNPYRSRFIQPLGANSFPRNYSMPLDVWQKDPAGSPWRPLPAEAPPFSALVGVEEFIGGQPTAYKLLQNYPNPFNPATRIRYTIPERANVTLKVFNLLGQEVATLVNEEQFAGNYVARFEANNLATGVYFYRLQAGSFSQVKKMLLLK